MMHLGAGATNIRGWQVVAAATQEIAWSHESRTGFIEALDGQRFVDVSDGGSAQGPYGGVEQTVFLIPGALYELVLSVGASADKSGPQVSVTATPAPRRSPPEVRPPEARP
jgi:hypothetical protein